MRRRWLIAAVSRRSQEGKNADTSVPQWVRAGRVGVPTHPYPTREYTCD